MELPVIVHELKTLNEEYKKRLTDKEPATAIYCNGFCTILQKFLDKHNGSYEEYVFSLCIFLCHFAASYGELAVDNSKEKICQQLFRLCIKAVLDVKWKELSEDNTCRQKFRETVEAVHTQLERFDFYQFQLIKTLMETHWDHPTLSRIMAGTDDLEEQEVMEYFAEEDPIVLKVRVEMLLDENCEEFALNLCKWCCLHPALIDNVEIRETQLFMLYRTGNMDKIQEECAKISSEMAVQIIRNLQECDAQQSFCVMIAQTFLVQNWVRGLSADSGTKILLKLWIRLQYLVDGNLDKFSDSIWAIAKLSQHTEQITFLVDALREEAGDTFLQLNTILCIYAFNLDKGCLEQAVADKDMELILCRNVALSKTSQMIMKLYHDLCPKLAKLSAVTAFALDPSEENFEIVYTIFHSIKQGPLSKSLTSQHEDNLLDSNSPNKFVNKLTNMLDSLHVSPTKETKRLRPKAKYERNRHSMSHRTVDNVEYCGLSVNPATLYEVERLLNNICPFHLDIDINFTDLQNICMEHLTRHQEMLMVLHEESTDECSEYSNYEDEQADRALIIDDLTEVPDNGIRELSSLEVDESTQKLGCVDTESEQRIGDAKCMCDDPPPPPPPLDIIGQKSCQSSFEASNIKYNTNKTACHSNQTCPNNVSSRNLFDAFTQDLSSKASCFQHEEEHHMKVDADRTLNTVGVGYCTNMSEKSTCFPSCGASPAGNCRCDKSLSVHTCLSFDSQIDFANMIDNNTPSSSAPPSLHGMDKSASNYNSKFYKMRVRDERCCSSSTSLPNSITEANTVHVPTSLKCMCKMKSSKSSKKSDKSLKCDKKLQQLPESNNKEIQSKSSGCKDPTEDVTSNVKLLEKLKSCISAQTGSDSQNINEKFTLSKMEKSYIDRYCQFLKTVRQFEMAMLTQKNCKSSAKQKQNYLVVYRCGICCEFFNQVSDLKEHIQSICKAAVMDMKNLTEAASIFCTKDSVLSKIKFFKCLKCLQYTCTRREMDDHLRLCGIPLTKKPSSTKAADIVAAVQKTELHKPSLVISGNLITSTDSLQTSENNNSSSNNSVSLVKTESETISEVLPSLNDSSKRLLVDVDMATEMACQKLDAPSTEIHPQVKCQEENVEKNAKPKATNEEYFKCQMCGRLLLGPHRHRLHLEACKKRCEWRKDRRLKRMSLAKPSEKAHTVIKRETLMPATTLTTTSTAMVKNLPMNGVNSMKISTSKENLSSHTICSSVAEIKHEINPKPPMPQPEKPKHCPDCERIIKLRKVSQQLGITEKFMIKTEPQETPSKQDISSKQEAYSKQDTSDSQEAISVQETPIRQNCSNQQDKQCLPTSSKQNIGEIPQIISNSEIDAVATTATAAVVVVATAATVADLQMENTNMQELNDNMNTDECIKRTMLQIKSEMENEQLMKKKVELQFQRISNSASNIMPSSSSSVHGDITCRNQLSVSFDSNISNTTQNSDLAKLKIESIEEGQLRKKFVGTCKNQLNASSDSNISNTNQNSDLIKSQTESVGEVQIRKRSTGNPSPYCRKCDFHFRSSSNFVKHLAITHLQPYTKEKIPDPDSNTVIFHCNFCQGSFQVWFKYINHIPNHSALILERLNCKLVEVTYSVLDEAPLPSNSDPTDSSNKHVKTNHNKKKTLFQLVWPPPEEDIGTFFKRKRRRGTYKNRRSNRNNIPHPNPSLGNLSKTTIMDFTRPSSDADDNTKKEILQVMNDLLQKIVGTNEQAHNIMDVGSMPKSVTKKKKVVPLPVHCISSNCPSSNPISDGNKTGAVPFHRPQAGGQLCTAKIAANIPLCKKLKETPPIVPGKELKNPQKCELSTVTSSFCCSLQKTKKEELKKSAIDISPHSSKNNCGIHCCIKPVNVPQRNQNVCSFNKVDTSLKDSLTKANLQDSCTKNLSFQERNQDSSALPSNNKSKNCSQINKICNIKPGNLQVKSGDNNITETSVISQQVDTIKKKDFSEATAKTIEDKSDSSLSLPTVCKPSILHSSCVVPSVSSSSSTLSSKTFSVVPLISNPASLSKKPTSPTCVSLVKAGTTEPAYSDPTSDSAPTTTSKSAPDFVPLFTTSFGASSSSVLLQSTYMHVSKPFVNVSTGNASVNMSCPVSPAMTNASSLQTYKSESTNSQSCASSVLPNVTLQSTTTFAPTTTNISETTFSSHLPLCPNPLFITTKVLTPLTEKDVPPNSTSVSTTNLHLSSASSKVNFTSTTPIQMCQTITTCPTSLTSATTSNSPSIMDPISTSNANSLVSMPSDAVDIDNIPVSFAPPTTNISTISVSSVKAPILSTCSYFKSANSSASTSTSNLSLTNLCCPDNKTRTMCSKSVASEADISQSLKDQTLSETISKVTESPLTNLDSTITNVNTTQVIKSTNYANFSSSNTEACNNLISTAVTTKSTSALNIVSTETVTSPTIKSAGVNCTCRTTETVCRIKQSDADLISLPSTTVLNMAFTQPLNVTTIPATANSYQESGKHSSDVPSTTVPTKLTSISAKDICSINCLSLSSEVKSNATTTDSACLTPVIKSLPNVSKNIVFTSPTSIVPLSNIVSTSTTTLSNDSTVFSYTATNTCSQVPTVNNSVSTSVSKNPVLNVVSSSLPYTSAGKSSIIALSTNPSTIIGSKTSSTVFKNKPCIISKPDAATTAAAIVPTLSTPTDHGLNVSRYGDHAAVSMTSSALLAGTASVTSEPSATVSSSKTLISASKSSTSIPINMDSTAAIESATAISVVKTCVSGFRPAIISSSTNTTIPKATTAALMSKTSTIVTSTMTPTITSATSNNMSTFEALKLSSTISKSPISNIVSETTSTVSPVNSSIEVTKSSSNAKPLIAYCTKKSSSGYCTTFSCTTTTVKPSATLTVKVDPIVTSCPTVSIPETSTLLSTSTFNQASSFSPCTFTTAASLSNSSTSITFVTPTITPAVSAITQDNNKFDDCQITLPDKEKPSLDGNYISSQIETFVQPLTIETPAIKTESVHCSHKNSVSESGDDCNKVALSTSKVELLKETKSRVSSPFVKDCETSNNEGKILHSNISCQDSLHCSQSVDMQLINEDPCNSGAVTLTCESESSPIFTEKKSSNYINYTTITQSFSNKEVGTTGCDVKLSTSCENMSCNLMNLCKKNILSSKDEPIFSSEDCKFGCSQECTENCEKEFLHCNDEKLESEEIVKNSSDGSLSSIDEIKDCLACKVPHTPQSNEELAQSSKEHINENVTYDKDYTIYENSTEEDKKEIAFTESKISVNSEQCKHQFPKNALEALSERDESRENAKSKCPDKEKIHPTCSKQLCRSRGRPRKTNAELLLSSVSSRQKLLNPGNIINFRLRKDRPTLKTGRCSYCCCKKRCQISCVQNKCKSCIAEGTSVCRCNMTETQLTAMQKVALSNSTMCLNCHSNNKRASRGNKRKRSPSPKHIRHHSNFHSPLKSSSVSNQRTSASTRLQKLSSVPFKKKLTNSPHKKTLASSSHKKLTGGNLKKLSSEYHKQKKFMLSPNKNFTKEFPKKSSIISLKSESPSELLQDTQNISSLVTRRTLRSRKSLDETTPVIKHLRRSKSEQKLDSCIDDISKKSTDLLSIDSADATLINSKLSHQYLNVETKITLPLPCLNNEEVYPENFDKNFVGNRALKELRQRVKLGPFKWDLEESETGGRAHSMSEDSRFKVTTTTTTTKTDTNLHTSSKDMKGTAQESPQMSCSSLPSLPPSASSPSFSSFSPSATADDELLGTGVTPPIRTYSRTQSLPSRIRVGRTYSKASDYQALPPGVMPVMPIIDCLRPTSHSSASHLCDMPRVHVVRVDKKGNMFETREPYPLPRNPLDLDMSRTVVDDEKGGGHRWKLQRTKMKTDGYPFSFKKTRIQ